jgi:peptidyl-prolyl cis-trans isomerase SurA
MDKQKVLSIGVLVLLVAALGGYMMFGKSKTEKSVAANSSAVAKVNGVPITEAAFNAQLGTTLANLNAQGVEATSTEQMNEVKNQVLDDLINNELVNQGIAQAGITVKPEDVNTQYLALVSQLGGQDKMNAQIKQASTTEAQVRSNIEQQMKIQAFLLKNIDVNLATVTDKEVSDYYKANTQGQKNVPALKDVSAQIKQQLVSAKQQQLILNFISTLRAKATIEKNLK